MAEPSRLDWEIRRFDRSFERTRFDCGVAALNDWLKHRLSQYEKRDLCRTYAAVRRGHSIVLGYYTLSGHTVTFDSLPRQQSKGLPRHDVPVVLLGRLAVDRSVQGRGLGECLLIDALRRIDRISAGLGIRAVEVEAIDARARQFYLKYGFFPLQDDPLHLFLPIRVVRTMDL